MPQKNVWTLRSSTFSLDAEDQKDKSWSKSIFFDPNPAFKHPVYNNHAAMLNADLPIQNARQFVEFLCTLLKPEARRNILGIEPHDGTPIQSVTNCRHYNSTDECYFDCGGEAEYDDLSSDGQNGSPQNMKSVVDSILAGAPVGTEFKMLGFAVSKAKSKAFLATPRPFDSWNWDTPNPRDKTGNIELKFSVPHPAKNKNMIRLNYPQWTISLDLHIKQPEANPPCLSDVVQQYASLVKLFKNQLVSLQAENSKNLRVLLNTFTATGKETDLFKVTEYGKDIHDSYKSSLAQPLAKFGWPEIHPKDAEKTGCAGFSFERDGKMLSSFRSVCDYRIEPGQRSKIVSNWVTIAKEADEVAKKDDSTPNEILVATQNAVQTVAASYADIKTEEILGGALQMLRFTQKAAETEKAAEKNVTESDNDAKNGHPGVQIVVDAKKAKRNQAIADKNNAVPVLITEMNRCVQAINTLRSEPKKHPSFTRINQIEKDLETAASEKGEALIKSLSQVIAAIVKLVSEIEASFK